jgi:hypothetical protein
VPHSFDELRSVRHTLELYRRNYAVHIAALLVAVHMFLQVGGGAGLGLWIVVVALLVGLNGADQLALGKAVEGAGLRTGFGLHWCVAPSPPPQHQHSGEGVDWGVVQGALRQRQALQLSASPAARVPLLLPALTMGRRPWCLPPPPPPQAFMMPGSILINVLAGSMYSLPGGSGLPLGWACHWSGAARPPAGMLPAQGHARMWRGVYRTKQ